MMKEKHSLRSRGPSTIVRISVDSYNAIRQYALDRELVFASFSACLDAVIEEWKQLRTHNAESGS